VNERLFVQPERMLSDDGHDKREASLPPGPRHPNDTRDLEPLGSSALRWRGMVYVTVENFAGDLKRSVARSLFLSFFFFFLFFFFTKLYLLLYFYARAFSSAVCRRHVPASEYP